MNSLRATLFRQWATSVLRQYAIRGGYVLDKKRMENSTFLCEGYSESAKSSFYSEKIKKTVPLVPLSEITICYVSS